MSTRRDGSRPSRSAAASTGWCSITASWRRWTCPPRWRRREECGATLKMQETSFFLGRQTLIPSQRPGMAIWREHLFAWMVRNAESAMEFFKLPANRVVALGSQVEI